MRKLILFSIFILLMSCNFSIPPVEHHFYNQSASDVTVTPNPETGEDWVAFTLAANGGNATIENVDTTISFTPSIAGTDDAVQYVTQMQDSDVPPYTYIFYDFDPGYDLTLLP